MIWLWTLQSLVSTLWIGKWVKSLFKKREKEIKSNTQYKTEKIIEIDNWVTERYIDIQKENLLNIMKKLNVLEKKWLKIKIARRWNILYIAYLNVNWEIWALFKYDLNKWSYEIDSFLEKKDIYLEIKDIWLEELYFKDDIWKKYEQAKIDAWVIWFQVRYKVYWDYIFMYFVWKDWKVKNLKKYNYKVSSKEILDTCDPNLMSEDIEIYWLMKNKKIKEWEIPLQNYSKYQKEDNYQFTDNEKGDIIKRKAELIDEINELRSYISESTWFKLETNLLSSLIKNWFKKSIEILQELKEYIIKFNTLLKKKSIIKDVILKSKIKNDIYLKKIWVKIKKDIIDMKVKLIKFLKIHELKSDFLTQDNT